MATTDGSTTYDPPSLSKAWEYFRDQTLPHRVKDETQDVSKNFAATGFRKAEPGEGGELYDPFRSSVKDMSEFGLGVGLYFSTLIGLFFVMLAAGLCASPTIAYFKSEDFNKGQDAIDNGMLSGSAICSGASVYAVQLDSGSWAVKHDCPVDSVQLGSDIALLIILAIFAIVTGRAQDKISTLIDESQQTAQDYAVVVTDPDDDATDPEEWRKYFSKWGEVAYITIALNNGPLLKALAKGRLIQKNIRFNDPRHEFANASDDKPSTGAALPEWKKKLQPLGMFKDLAYWLEARKANHALLDQLRQGNYVPAKVFCIFETEEAQRACLEALCEGIIPAATDIGSRVAQEDHFRGDNVLMVQEPVEPSEVLYENLGKGLVHFQAHYTQMAITSFLTACLLVGAFFAIEAGSNSGGAAGALTVSAINIALPVLLKIITMLEDHVDAGDQQNSMLNKLVIARMLNTAVLIYILTDFEDTLTETAIGQINSILISDAFTAPTLRILNIANYVKQFIIARTAVTQEKMNSYFDGGAWNLAERYTDMSKTLFVSLFYSSLLPSGVFITALSFVTTYWVDKWCMLRTWRTPPALDGTLAEANRSHIVFAVYVHLVMTARFWAGWPFDKVCGNEDAGYYYCDREDRAFFFPRGRAFMSDTQYNMVEVYGWMTLFATIILATLYVWSVARYSIRALFSGQYDPVGEPQGIAYSTVDQIATYVPNVVRPQLTLPLLACDLSKMNREHIEFTGDFDANNVCCDADLPGITEEEKTSIFSQVVCYKWPEGQGPGAELAVVAAADVAVSVPSV